VPPELPHDELQEEQRRLARLFVDGEVILDAAFFFAPERRVGKDHIYPIPVSDLPQRMAQAVAGIYLRRLQPVQEQVNLRQEVGERLRLAPEDALPLQYLPVLHCLALSLRVAVGLNEEAASPASRV
jgi:hypothetical protein